MPTEERTRKIFKVGDSEVVSLPPGWLRYWKSHFKKHGKNVKVLTNTLMVIYPEGVPELEAKARRIVEGKD